MPLIYSSEQQFRTQTNERLGADAEIATTATVGFALFPTCAGVPTGVPAAVGFPTLTPMVFDSVGMQLYAYTGGSWVAL